MRYFHLSDRDKDECRAIVDYCVDTIWRDYDDSLLTVIVNDSPAKRRGRVMEYSGKAYGKAYDSDTNEGFVRPAGVPKDLMTDYVVVISLHKELERILPITEWGGGHSTARDNYEWPTHRLKTWQEVFCCIAAHELWHTIQYLNDLAHSEIDCERCAEIVLKGWRKENERRQLALCNES